MTRNLPWLVEAMPEVFVELSPELADKKGIKSGDRVRVTTARSHLGGWAIVTKRFRPFKLKDGQEVHQIGVPWHWGFMSDSKGCSANALTPHVGDANTMIPEYKAFLCDVKKSPINYDGLKGEEPEYGREGGKEVS